MSGNIDFYSAWRDDSVILLGIDMKRVLWSSYLTGLLTHSGGYAELPEYTVGAGVMRRSWHLRLQDGLVVDGDGNLAASCGQD